MPCPQGARTASHRYCMCPRIQGHVHSMECPRFSAVGAGNKMLLWRPNIGFVVSSLLCPCSCKGEATTCVHRPTGLRDPFWALSVEAGADQQASYIIKCYKFSKDPGHRNPRLLTHHPSSILTLQSTRFQSSAMVPGRESWTTVSSFHNSK